MPLLQYLKRKWLLRKPFPDIWLNILRENVPYYSILPKIQQQTLQDRITIFMDEKLFEGCGGFELTEKVEIVISAYACVLILGEPSDYYGDLRTILVYPDDYMAPVMDEDSAGIITEGSEPRKGESWDIGSIVLSWKDIERNLYKNPGRENLIFHEFAHQLDDRYGLSAGVREDGKPLRDDEWTQTVAKVYKNLRKSIRLGKPTSLDPYGAEEPAELFAVATEA
ncbi:MAG: hypothetical protein EA391_12700, partial [Balneolaceae bacterium]